MDASASKPKVVQMGDHYAVVRDGEVIGTIERCDENDSQWGWFPVSGTEKPYLRLRYAIQEAIRDALR